MERVEHRGRVVELVTDRGLVSRERVQCGHLDTVTELGPAFLQPARVGLPGPAGHEIEQPGAYATVLVAGEVDYPGQFLRAVLAGVGVMPDVVVDTESRHTGEAPLVTGELLESRTERAPRSGHPVVPAQSTPRLSCGTVAIGVFDMDAVEAEEQVAPLARSHGENVRARGGIVSHVEVLVIDQIAWSLLIIEGLGLNRVDLIPRATPLPDVPRANYERALISSSSATTKCGASVAENVAVR